MSKRVHGRFSRWDIQNRPEAKTTPDPQTLVEEARESATRIETVTGAFPDTVDLIRRLADALERAEVQAGVR